MAPIRWRAVLLAALCVAPTSAQDITVDVDWAAFLSRHDLEWDWIWGSTKASTLSPRNEQLHRCGPGGAAGQCCLEATEPAPAAAVAEEFPGFIQLALARQAPWSCAASASPPQLCCLPVPGADISGCHGREEKRWAFNEFFSVAASAGTNGTFHMMDKNTKSCYTLATGAKAPSLAPCNAAAAGASEQQLWKVLTPSSEHYLLQNVASGTCVSAVGAKEGSPVTMGSCNPSGDNSWQPVCDGSTPPLPNWPCLKVSPSPPHPSPTPAPPPPPPPPVVQGDAVLLAACDGTKPNQQWHIESSGQINVGDGKRCLTNGGVVAPCNQTGQTWGPPAPIDGFFQLSSGAADDDDNQKADDTAVRVGASGSGSGSAAHPLAKKGLCLQINTPQLFCGDPGDTVCPKAYLQNFKAVSLASI